MKRMKTYINPTLLSVCLLLSACGESNEPGNLPEDGKGTALSIVPTVEDATATPLTRATKMFFNDYDEISVNIKTTRDAAGTDYTYIYNEGTFSGKDNKGFFFSLDNTAISELTATWPSAASKEKTGIVLDQRKDKDFQQADELQAEVKACNIMPTAAPLPLIFKHMQSRLTFKMAGQNANGLNIEKLILELEYHVSGEGDSEVTKPGAFWAHCSNNYEYAELILPAGTTISADKVANTTVNSEGRYMIGEATISGTTNYTGGIWLASDTEVTLKAGYEYIVTLTPEGYNLVANFEIHGFSQDEGYIGIPIQMPTLKEGTTYSIDNCTQLVTLSQILAGNIKDASAKTWKGYSYILKSGLQLTKYAEKWYEKIDSSLKESLFKGEDGTTPITEITDQEGNPFSLFKED